MIGKSKILIELSYNDLIKLIGGTDEAVIELRKGVAASMVEKFWKQSVSGEIRNNIGTETTKAIQRELYDGNVWNGKLKEKVAKSIRDAFNAELGTTISSVAREARKEVSEEFDEKIKSVIDLANKQLEDIREQYQKCLDEVKAQIENSDKLMDAIDQIVDEKVGARLAKMIGK